MVEAAVVVQDEDLVILMRHVERVKDYCCILGRYIFNLNNQLPLKYLHGKSHQLSRQHFAKSLIANGYAHDNSKFTGFESQYLNIQHQQINPILFTAAVRHHQINNMHHPEYWCGGIHEMPPLYLAEMVCDWTARSAEFGTDLRRWIKTNAMIRYNFKPQHKVYAHIKLFVDILLEPSFK